MSGTGGASREGWEHAATPSGGDPIRLADFEALALAKLPPGSGAYYSGAANDEVTLRDNVAAFDRWRFVPRIGVEIRDRDASVDVLGRRWPSPFMVAPMALHRLAHPDGEVAVARACAERGLVFCLSTVGSAAIEDVAATGAARWFQLYLLDDEGRNRELLRRAEAAGYEAIVFTMDAAILGRRERDIRAGFSLPADVTYANIRRRAVKRDETYGDDEFKLSNTWDDLAWVVGATRLPVVVKGVLHPDDAVRALDLGAAAVDVSNHGGRQLDRSVAAIDASLLPDPPLDPFTGQPYHIEHREGRLFVYSIGPNLRDEHGDYNYRKWGTKFANQDDVGAIGWDVELRGLVVVEDGDVESGESAAR